jgi:hypothetical protein
VVQDKGGGAHVNGVGGLQLMWYRIREGVVVNGVMKLRITQNEWEFLD